MTVQFLTPTTGPRADCAAGVILGMTRSPAVEHALGRRRTAWDERLPSSSFGYTILNGRNGSLYGEASRHSGFHRVGIITEDLTISLLLLFRGVNTTTDEWVISSLHSYSPWSTDSSSTKHTILQRKISMPRFTPSANGQHATSCRNDAE